MSVANKEEVGTRRLLQHLGEPAVSVPIKKRPISSSDRSPPTMPPPLMKSLSSAPEVPVSAEQSFNTAKQDANVINKGKGIITSQISDHANRSFTLPMANSKGVLLDGSNEIASCAEIDRSIGLLDESKKQKFSALDLQLASCRNGKNNYGSVKEEKVDQCFSGHHSAQPRKNVQIANQINASSNISSGKLPSLDLNMPFDPVDSDEGIPAMYERGNGPYHGLIQCQNAQLPTISSGPGHNIDSLNLPDSYRPSHKCEPGDVTLDLQLKLPARPEIGKNWKGLAPAPELNLSLSGTPMDKPIALSMPNDLCHSEPALSLENVSEEAARPRLDKSPVEEAVSPVLCKVNPQNTPTVTGTDKMVSKNMAKIEPEEPYRQHILNNVGRAHLFEQQNVPVVNNCAEYENTDSAPQVSSKAQFDLNSDIFPNNSIHNGPDIITDNVSTSGPCLAGTVPIEAMPVVPNKILKSVKRKKPTSDVPSPSVATVSGDAAAAPVSLAAKSLSSGINVVNCPVGSCELSIQAPVSPLEPSFSSIVWKPPASHLRAQQDMTRRPCNPLQLQSLSNPVAESLIHNSQSYAAKDGMSQGSAEMDCSDDDDNTIFRLPTADRPQGGPSSNGPTMEDGINLPKELKKELDSDTSQDCSSVTNKVSMKDVNGDKCVKIRDGIISHSGEEEHQREVFVDEESKENQLLKLDKICMLNQTDNNMPDVKTATGSSSIDLQRSPALQNPASSKTGSIKQSPATLDSCPQKTKSLDMKPENSLSPHGKLAAGSSEDYAKHAAVKTEHGTEIEEAAGQSDVRPRDSVMGENLGIDGASSSEPHSSCGRVKATSENSDEKSKPDSYMTTSVSNERDSQLIGPNRRDLGYAYVNRNERWEMFMESEREKTKGGYQDGKHGPDMINQRRTDHCYGGRGAGSQGYQKNFRGPRMSNEFPFEDDLGHLHRMSHRLCHSPRAVCRRDIYIDSFHGTEILDPRLLAHGQIEELPVDIIQERFFRPHSRRHPAQGDHGFIHRDRSHSPAQRRGPPAHFHKGRSPEAMHRSPPLPRTERTCLPYRRHTRRHGSPLNRIGHDDRGMQGNTRRCGMIDSHQVLEGDDFEPPLHPAHLGGLNADEELVDRRKYGDRRPRLRSLEQAPADDDEMLSYHLEEEMEFAECGGPHDLDGRLRNRMGHRAKGGQDSCRHRGPQGWRDVESNDNRPKRRRY